MELRHLRYFVAVAEEGAITRAAARLNVSQPPLSRQIQDLERELGVALLDRSMKQVRLTAAGRAFLKDARAVLQRVDDATRRARSHSDQNLGQLRVGYSPAPTVELLPRALAAFRRQHPKVDVVLLDLASDEMLSELKARKLDVMVVVEPPLKKDSGLVFEPLQRMPIGLVVALDHPFAHRKSVTLQEAMEQPLIAFTRRGYTDYHHWLKQAVRHARITPKIVAYADGVASVMAAVQSGQGVAFGPPGYREVAGNRAKYLPIVPAAPPVIVGLVTRLGTLSPSIEAFRQALRSLPEA